MKKCSNLCKEVGTRNWISRVAHDCKPPNVEHVQSMPEVEESCQLEHYRTKSTDWPLWSCGRSEQEHGEDIREND